jgi:lysophospholipase L1-like esterase
MANYANLLATIAANIYTNGNNEVTAAMVKTAVDQMVASLGAGYQFMGVATPATNPGTPDQKVCYLASEEGTYTDFGGIVVNEGELAILKGSGSSWSKDVAKGSTDTFGVSRVLRYGVYVADPDDLALSSGNTQVVWWKSNQKVNRVGGVIVYGTGDPVPVSIYKVTENPADNTAAFTLITTASGNNKELLYIPVDIELGENEYIGMSGVMYAVAKSNTPYDFSSWYCSNAAQDSPILENATYYPVIGLVCSTMRQVPYYAGKKILLYGDSITNGYIPGGAHGTYYEGFIKEKTDATAVVKKGYDSACCARKSGWNNYLSDDTRLQDLIAQDPDVVLMLTGTNDYQLGNPIGQIGDGLLTTFIGSLTYIIQTIMQSLPDCVIVLCTPTPYYGSMATGSLASGRAANAAGNNIRDYAEAVIALARQYSVPVCDVNAMAGWLDTNEALKIFTTDGVHLSQKGYDRITSIQAGFYKTLFSK